MWAVGGLVGLAVAVAAFVLVAGGGQDDSGGARSAGGLEVVRERHLDERLREVTFKTDSLDDETSVRILLPEGYGGSARRYPVLYLLHGSQDDFRSWTDVGRAEALTDGLPLIVVMPDGGAAGFYSDWFNGGDGGPPEWETYHIDQLIPWVDANFRTVPGRNGRAVAGISMGGFGALSYAARHPGTFAAAASFSGAVDSNYEPFIPFFESAARTPDGEPAIWGPRETEEKRWRAHNPWDLAMELRGTEVMLFTGNGQVGGELGGGPDPVEKAVHAMNVSVHQRLQELGIEHRFVDYGPGAHNLLYGARDLEQALPELMRALQPGARSGG